MLPFLCRSFESPCVFGHSFSLCHKPSYPTKGCFVSTDPGINRHVEKSHSKASACVMHEEINHCGFKATDNLEVLSTSLLKVTDIETGTLK